MATQNWMGNVVGNLFLSQLSIPGTHDSLTYDATLAAQDQDSDFTILDQLNAGIRLFDLRLRVVVEGQDTAMVVGWHGGELANTEFQQYILEPTINFLTDNPTECVLYVLTNNGDDSLESWDEVVQTYMKAKDPGWPEKPRLFYTNNVVPTLDEVRGRIVMCVGTYGTGGLSPWGLDFSGFPYDQLGVATNTLTLDGSSPITFNVQGIYDDQEGLADPAIEGKAIQSNLQGAAANTDPRNWFITSTSRADGAPTSKAFATGWGSDFPWPAPMGYNQVALDQINNLPVDGSVGAVYSDFPNDTPGYIQAIINHNPPKVPGWDFLGGTFISAPGAVSWDQSSAIVEPVFALTPGPGETLQMGVYLPHSMDVQWAAVNPPPPEVLGGSRVIAVGGGPERYDVFALAGEDDVCHWHHSDSGASWQVLKGCPWPPAVVSPAPGRLDLFASNGEQILHMSWDDSGWSPWEELGPAPGMTKAFTPAAVASGENRLDVFTTCSSDGQTYSMYHKAWDGSSWGAWEDLGNTSALVMAAVSPAPGRLDVIAVGDQTYHKAWDGGSWGPWEALGAPQGGISGAGPAVVSSAAGRLDVFAAGADIDPHMYYKAWDGRSWGPWQDLGAPPAGGFWPDVPGVVSPTAGRLDVFAVGNYIGYRQMYHTTVTTQPTPGPAR